MQVHFDLVEILALAAVRADGDLAGQLEIEHPIARLDFADVAPRNGRLRPRAPIDAAGPRAPQTLAIGPRKFRHTEVRVEGAGQLAEAIDAQRLAIERHEEVALDVDVVERRRPHDGAAVIEHGAPFGFGARRVDAEHHVLPREQGVREQVVGIELQRALGRVQRSPIEIAKIVGRLRHAESFPPGAAILGDDERLDARRQRVAVWVDLCGVAGEGAGRRELMRSARLCRDEKNRADREGGGPHPLRSRLPHRCLRCQSGPKPAYYHYRRQPRVSAPCRVRAARRARSRCRNGRRPRSSCDTCLA